MGSRGQASMTSSEGWSERAQKARDRILGYAERAEARAAEEEAVTGLRSNSAENAIAARTAADMMNTEREAELEANQAFRDVMQHVGGGISVAQVEAFSRGKDFPRSVAASNYKTVTDGLQELFSEGYSLYEVSAELMFHGDLMRARSGYSGLL